jgi:hypothetical protein
VHLFRIFSERRWLEQGQLTEHEKNNEHERERRENHERGNFAPGTGATAFGLGSSPG